MGELKEKIYLDTMHNECKRLRCIVYEIDSLAVSFSDTGNNIIANKLFGIAADINNSERNIHSSVGKDIDKRWRDSQEMSAAVLGAALSSSMIIHKEGENETKE